MGGRRIFFLLALLTLCACRASAGEPVRVREAGEGNLAFDARVFLPEKQTCEVFRAKRRELDGDWALALLRPQNCAEWTKEERRLATPDTFYSDADEDWLRVEAGSLSYSTRIMRSYEEVLGFMLPYFSIPNAGPAEDSHWDTARDPASDAAPVGSLSFIAPEEAVRRCREWLAALGVEQEAVLIRCDAVAYRDLLDAAGRMALEDEMYADFLRSGKTADIQAFERHFDFYCLTFGFLEDGLWVYGPLEQRLPERPDVETALPQSVQILYTENGIASALLGNLVCRASDGRREEILDFARARSIAADFLRADARNSYTCLQAYVSYIPVGNYYQDDLTYRPFWNFYLVYESDGEELYRVLRVDAVSGAVIG